MLNHLDNYFFSLEEPHRSCLLFLRQFILNYSNQLSEQWKFNTPFYYYNNKWFCYISYHKKTKLIYIGFVQGYKIKHSKLLSEGRKQVKVFYIDPEKDIDVKNLNAIFKKACSLYKK
ncbi:MAG: DUF1801 domain-containing protein [Bacteroidota bacterium]|nr:DUF1801 domain-containing protein [Bacteroidota bacterium]MDP3144449.1 DUF1801 domain-containing protein [Bacteroidota bacterium]